MTDLSVQKKTGQRGGAAKHKIRFVTATSLFDGHDASINVMRRILQASGAEVIHLGHNRSVDEIVTAALSMCEQFHQAYLFTREFSKVIADSKLVEERTLDVQLANGEKMNVGTFMAVNEEKFKALSDVTILDWKKKGFLHAVYFHLQSLNNWDMLLAKANDRANAANPPSA